jgi:hypothetical protein
MVDPKQVAERIVGRVDWQSEVSGFCKCPGEGMHTSANGKKDCRVNIDGAPTIFCCHASCVRAVAVTNRRLRRELACGPWAIALPGERMLRNGDVLKKSGIFLAVLTTELLTPPSLASTFPSTDRAYAPGNNRQRSLQHRQPRPSSGRGSVGGGSTPVWDRLRQLVAAKTVTHVLGRKCNLCA